MIDCGAIIGMLAGWMFGPLIIIPISYAVAAWRYFFGPKPYVPPPYDPGPPIVQKPALSDRELRRLMAEVRLTRRRHERGLA